MNAFARTLALTAFLGGALSGCMQIQGRSQPLDGAVPVAAKPAGCAVDIYDTESPARPFVRIARLDAHMEVTHLLPISKENLLPELKRQACLVGADAIIDVKERHSGYLETNMYHLTATGIVYR